MNKLIIETLKPIGIPVGFMTLTTKEPTYVTFFEYNQRSHMQTDDELAITRHSVQIDVWSNVNYTNVVNQVRSLLKEAGFQRADEFEMYEDDTKIFHKAFRLYYDKQEVI